MSIICEPIRNYIRARTDSAEVLFVFTFTFGPGHAKTNYHRYFFFHFSKRIRHFYFSLKKISFFIKKNIRLTLYVNFIRAKVINSDICIFFVFRA